MKVKSVFQYRSGQIDIERNRWMYCSYHVCKI